MNRLPKTPPSALEKILILISRNSKPLSGSYEPFDPKRTVVINEGKLFYSNEQKPEILVISFDVGGLITPNTDLIVYEILGVNNKDVTPSRIDFYVGKIGIDEYVKMIIKSAWKYESKISEELRELRTDLGISPGKKPSRNIVKNLLLMFSTPIEPMLNFIKEIRSDYQNIILGVASNQGSEIAEILRGELEGYVDFQVYSCKVRRSKYDGLFWDCFLESANGVARKRGAKIIGFENIVHIDDHIGKINALTVKGGFGIIYEHLEPIKLLREAIDHFIK